YNFESRTGEPLSASLASTSRQRCTNLRAITLDHLRNATSRSDCCFMILREVETNAVRAIGTELRSRCNRDPCLHPQRANKLVQRYIELRQAREEIAACLRRAHREPRD